MVDPNSIITFKAMLVYDSSKQSYIRNDKFQKSQQSSYVLKQMGLNNIHRGVSFFAICFDGELLTEEFVKRLKLICKKRNSVKTFDETDKLTEDGHYVQCVFISSDANKDLGLTVACKMLDQISIMQEKGDSIIPDEDQVKRMKHMAKVLSQIQYMERFPELDVKMLNETTALINENRNRIPCELIIFLVLPSTAFDAIESKSLIIPECIQYVVLAEGWNRLIQQINDYEKAMSQYKSESTPVTIEKNISNTISDEKNYSHTDEKSNDLNTLVHEHNEIDKEQLENLDKNKDQERKILPKQLPDDAALNVNIVSVVDESDIKEYSDGGVIGHER